MQQALGDFIYALRQVGLPISSAETLDAIKAARLVGLRNENLLKQSLRATLVKRLDHQPLFDTTFERFFYSLNTDLSAVSDLSMPTISTQELSVFEQADTTEYNRPANSDNKTISDHQAMQSPLAQQLLAADQSSLQLAIAAAISNADTQSMSIFTQIPRITFDIMQSLGDAELTQELIQLSSASVELNEIDTRQDGLINLVRMRRRRLRQYVRDLVEQQYLLFGQNKPKQLREQNLQKIKLSSIDHHHQQLMASMVKKAAKQLASMHSRRRKITKRGKLDVRKTIAANAAYDGFLFHTKWKATRVDRPKIMVLCDVSGSVSRVSRFLLLFLHSLQDVIPKVRSFVFSSELAEVTDLFNDNDIETALAKIMEKWGNMPTNYGQALLDFNSLAVADIDNKTTVIILGDARNNYGQDHVAIWRDVYQKSQRVLWLNPEDHFNWNSGDSIMDTYSPYCSKVAVCNSLRDLSRILGSVLKNN